MNSESKRITFPFLDYIDLIDLWNLHLFCKSARPMDFDRINLLRISQSEVYPLIIGGHKAAAAQHIPALPHTASGQVDGRSNRVSRASGAANQF